MRACNQGTSFVGEGGVCRQVEIRVSFLEDWILEPRGESNVIRRKQ